MVIISPEDRQTLQTLSAQELQDEVNITSFTQREYATCEGTDNLVPGEGAWYDEDSSENRNQEVRA